MTFEKYQEAAKGTAIYPSVFVPRSVPPENVMKMEELGIVYPALGLAGEAGEFANKVKKIIRDKGGVIDDEIKSDLIEELGDVLWYVAACAKELDVEIELIAACNAMKLLSRKERGVLSGSGDKR
jgi:NTP pyrophosphatase (non-canonical NTP hydrolase)